MAYEPKTWECGETITADDLNHIENGIADAGGGRFDVNVTMEYQTDHYEVTGFDKTIEEINTAYNEGKVVVAHANIFGMNQMLYLQSVYSDAANFTNCDVMGNQGNIFYLHIGNNSSFYWKAIN